MACFVVAVVPDSVAVVVCRSSASGRVLVRTKWTNKFVLLRTWPAPYYCCWLLIDHLFYQWWIFLFFLAHFYFPASGIQAVVTGVVLPLPPPSYRLHFFWRIGFSTHWSSIFYRVLLTHALTLSASQLVHKTKYHSSTHSGGFEPTKLTYTRLEDI